MRNFRWQLPPNFYDFRANFSLRHPESRDCLCGCLCMRVENFKTTKPNKIKLKQNIINMMLVIFNGADAR